VIAMSEEATTEMPVEAKTEDAPTAPPPKEMRAIVLTAFGGLKMVKTLQRPESMAKEGEILIRVKAW